MAPLPRVQVSSDLFLRELPSEEWHKLTRAHGVGGVLGVYADRPLPPSDEARILVGETPTGTIVAYWVISLAVHLDPLWVHDDYRHRSHFLLALIGALLHILKDGQVSWVWAIIADGDQPHNGILAEKLGLKRLPGSLYAGEVLQVVPDPALAEVT